MCSQLEKKRVKVYDRHKAMTKAQHKAIEVLKKQAERLNRKMVHTPRQSQAFALKLKLGFSIDEIEVLKKGEKSWKELPKKSKAYQEAKKVYDSFFP